MLFPVRCGLILWKRIKKIQNFFVIPNKDYVVSSAVWIDTMDQLKRSSATQEDINYLYLALW